MASSVERKREPRTSWQCETIEGAWSKSVFAAVKRVIVIGDVRGNLDYLRRCLILGGVLSAIHNHWIGGETWVVQTGDQVDVCLERSCDEQSRKKGARTVNDGEAKLERKSSTRESSKPSDAKNDMNDMDVLRFMEKLRTEAQVEGGNVITLLGHHEWLNLTGDMSYVNYASLRNFEHSFSKRRDAFQTKLQSPSPSDSTGRMAQLMLCISPTFVIIGGWMFGHVGIDAMTLKKIWPLVSPGGFARFRHMLKTPDTVQGILSRPASIVRLRNTALLNELNYQVRNWMRTGTSGTTQGRTPSSSSSSSSATRASQSSEVNAPVLDHDTVQSLFMSQSLGQQLIPTLLKTDDRTQRQQHHNQCKTLLLPVLRNFNLKGMVIGHNITSESTITSDCDNRLHRMNAWNKLTTSTASSDRIPTVIQISNDQDVTVLREKDNPLDKSFLSSVLSAYFPDVL